MSFLEVKGALAKLLATENLHVQHDGSATTASFNTATRVLTLPILSVDSSHVYDMFVGHEVGHALFTPTDWRDTIDESVPFDFVNVIEDVRIEKMIQAKFPGLKADFAHGYNELNDKDFFGIADKDYSELNFIDRINLHFKLGHRALMPFSEEEMVYVKAVDEADSYQKVCLVAKMLADYVNAKREQEQTIQQVTVPAQSGDGAEQESNDNTQSVQSDSQDEQPDDIEGEQQPVKNDMPDEHKSETQQAMDKAMESLVNNNLEKICYLQTPKTELNPFPIEFLRQDFQSQYSEVDFILARTRIAENFKKFTASIKRDVNFMVQQFEMKKSADLYRRSRIAKTGVLDTNKLHAYKLTDDVFLRHSVAPEGKNHGLVMLIDWSGSMSDHIVETVKQLLVLVSFCRKASIPFDVYTFTAQGYAIYDTPELESADNGEIMLGAVVCTHVLTSNAKNRQIDADMFHLYSQAVRLTASYSGAMYSNQLSMGGTPLNNALFGFPTIIEKFKQQNNVQKVSFVCLTDGESAPIHYIQNRAHGKGMAITNHYQTTLLRHGHKVFQIDTLKETPSIINYLTKLMPDVTITNIFLSGPKGAQSYCRHLTGKTDELKEFSKNGSHTFTTKNGWPLVALVNPRSFKDATEEMEVEAGAGKAKVKSALKKFLKNKTTSKMLLSTLVSQFA